jgi:hypothetical protein
MGASPYWYVVDYQPDLHSALHELRQREFLAGRYHPVIEFPRFPITPSSPQPGPEHDSIEDAIFDADADGTRSILDLDHVADHPDFNALWPLPDEHLMRYFGTTKPSPELVARSKAFWDDIGRGQGIAIVMYQNDTPSQIFIAGYSFD